jgi:hypothetical protein
MMLGLLEKSKDSWGGYERHVELDGGWLTIRQEGDLCSVIDAQSLPYARLSCTIENANPPSGWFWLRWWGENEEFWGKVASYFETGEEEVVVSEFVKTRSARLRRQGRASNEHNQEEDSSEALKR